MGSASDVFSSAIIISSFERLRQEVSHSFLSTRTRLPLLACLLSALFLGGCVGKSKWMGSTGPDTQKGSETASVAGEELARRSIFSPSSSDSNANYSIDLVERENTSEIEIALPPGLNKPQVTSLESPARIVIDLEGAQGPKTSSIDTPESLYVSRIRIGAHPDKSRVVLDMHEGQAALPSLQLLDNGNYKLSLSRAETSPDANVLAQNDSSEMLNPEPTSLKASPNTDELNESASAMDYNSQDSLNTEETAPSADTLALNSTASARETESPQFSEPSEASDSKMASPKLEDESFSNEIEDSKVKLDDTALVMKPNKVSSRPTIYSYQLQALSPSENTLVIEGDQLSRHSLKRTAPSEYVLRLPGAELAEGAQETIVAPQGSGAIRSVRAKSAGDVLELRIFTSPEESLEVKGSKDSLVVAASSGFGFADSLAQAKPEVAKEAAKEVVVKEGGDMGIESVETEISSLLGEKPRYTGRLISLDLQDTDIDNALRIIAEVSNLNIIASEEVTGKISLRLIDVPWDQALDVILKTNGLDMIQENNVIRIAPVDKLKTERESLKQARQAEEELEPLGVRYVRISYAKAAELKPLVESVLSERGSVAYDDRTNQLIIKDIRKGVVNVAELIAKLDLRTPQVLLETQIVEATRSLSRDLGSEFGFNFVQSPATGNATGYNFPNSISVGGSGTGGNVSSFPGADSSAITFLLESADGTRSLSTRLTALESEGRVKIVSRPAVATTNNKQATIKSVEKIRVKQPSGGLSVGVGQGAQASGSGTATETIEIGIILEVTPQASPDYYVLLDINAKSSTLGSRIVDGIPSEIERSATSSILVSSGQTFAMGGIYKTTDSNTVEGVPFLKDIPVLGHLFRRVLVNDQDEELLFFITPRIIEGSFDDAAMKAT